MPLEESLVDKSPFQLLIIQQRALLVPAQPQQEQRQQLAAMPPIIGTIPISKDPMMIVFGRPSWHASVVADKVQCTDYSQLLSRFYCIISYLDIHT
jgi:hypothetical protein